MLKGAIAGLERLWAEVDTARIWASLWLSFRLSFLAAAFNLVFGVALAWVLARYRFPGRRQIDAAVDLPFALPTAWMLAPAALTGFALSLARAVGEYGSVIFIAGNLPMKTEIAPLLIVIKLEEVNYEGATAIGIAMLVISFVLLLAINAIQVWNRRRIDDV